MSSVARLGGVGSALDAFRDMPPPSKESAAAAAAAGGGGGDGDDGAPGVMVEALRGGVGRAFCGIDMVRSIVCVGVAAAPTVTRYSTLTNATVKPHESLIC